MNKKLKKKSKALKFLEIELKIKCTLHPIHVTAKFETKNCAVNTTAKLG